MPGMQPTPRPRHVAVLGAGIAGLATAWALHQRGLSVTVIDRAQPGSGASAANGAQLSYAYVQPLADPGIWRQLPALLLAPDSPLRVRLQMDPRQWSWGLRFLAACRRRVSETTTRQLLALAARSRAQFDRMRALTGVEADFSAAGKLVVYQTADTLRAAERQAALQAQLGGSPQRVVGPQELLDIEPALAASAPRLAGGVYTPGDCAADCQRVCTGLHDWLRARGVQFVLDTPVTALQVRQGRVVAASTPRGAIEADAFVVATGHGSPALLRPLGVSLPVYPLRGYSVTVAARAADAPRVSVTDAARKTVFARLGDRLRVAGMVELAGHDTAVSARRIAELLRTARDVFPAASDYVPLHTWAGLRPATPTGRPIAGRHPRGPANLWLNTGHGALGFTLAFGTADVVAEDLDAGPI